MANSPIIQLLRCLSVVVSEGAWGVCALQVRTAQVGRSKFHHAPALTRTLWMV